MRLNSWPHQENSRAPKGLSRIHCRLCGSSACERLPNPHPQQAIVSNLAVIVEPLEKYACQHCGVIFRARGPVNFQSTAYDLYAHPPGGQTENIRQTAYANWISALAPHATGFFEAGCGNGSLLLALRALRPTARLRGVEPAPGAAAEALAAGLQVECDLLRARDVATEMPLAFAINVIEHTSDPYAFLRDLATHGREVLIVCPDGENPNCEILFADHLQSLSAEHLQLLFASVGLRVVAQQRAPDHIGPFFATLGVRDERIRSSTIRSARDHSAARRYLRTWAQLDTALTARLNRFDAVWCFGAGEAAALLRAYCPSTWSRVDACIVDSASSPKFFDKPVYDSADVPQGAIIIGARPAVQQALASRINAAGGTPIIWNDLISR